MPDQPLVSIIVPVYNAEKHLRRCVESILQQTYANIELLLVDDGSTDSSGQICEEYALADSRVRAFHKPNGGVSSARNYGLLRNRGGYLTFVDSDDWIDDRHIQNFLDNVDGYDWVMVGMKFVDAYGCIKEVRGVEKTISVHSFVEADFVCGVLPQFCWVTNKLYKTSIVKETNLSFMTESHIHEDRIFNLNYLQYVQSLSMFPESTYNYVENPNSLTHSYVSPNMFLPTADEFDRILRNRVLGINMSIYTGKFCIRFYILALGLCLVSPLSKLSLLQRWLLFGRAMKSMLLSYTVRRYKLKAVGWMLAELGAYAKKFLASR